MKSGEINGYSIAQLLVHHIREIVVGAPAGASNLWAQNITSEFSTEISVLNLQGMKEDLLRSESTLQSIQRRTQRTEEEADQYFRDEELIALSETVTFLLLKVANHKTKILPTAINLLKTKCRLLYFNAQIVLRCAHFSTRL
jgi:hypothetical protein